MKIENIEKLRLDHI